MEDRQPREEEPMTSVAILVGGLAFIVLVSERFDRPSLMVLGCALIAVVGTWYLAGPTETKDAPPVSPVVNQRVPGPPVPRYTPNQDAQHLESPVPPPEPTKLDVVPPATNGFPSLGDPGGLFIARLPFQASGVVDDSFVSPPAVISDSFSLDHYEVRAASRLGKSHAYRREPRQDDYFVTTAAEDRYLVTLVADGLGSAKYSHYGSHWTCRLLAKSIDLHLRDSVGEIAPMIDRAALELKKHFDSHFQDESDINMLSTTIVGLIAPLSGGKGIGFRIGDSDLMVNSRTGWKSVFESPAVGMIADTATKAFPSTTTPEVTVVDIGSDCLLLGTDGVFGPLEQSPDVVGATFSTELGGPVDEVTFMRLIGFNRRGAHDDRTAVAVWPK